MTTWRAIRQDIICDPRFLFLPDHSKLLYFHILTVSDSYGRLCGHPGALLHRFGPTLRTPSEFAESLASLHAAGLVEWYADPAGDQAWIEIAGFDEDQPNKNRDRRGRPKLPGRQDHHIDAAAVWCESPPARQPSLPLVEDHSSTTPRPVYLRKKERKRERIPSVDLGIVVEFWSKKAKKKRQAQDVEKKRITDVLKAHPSEVVKGYLEHALSDPWYWVRGQAHRRDIAQLFPTRGDRPWTVRIGNFLEPDSPAPSSGVPTYAPQDPKRADEALRAAMEGQP